MELPKPPHSTTTTTTTTATTNSKNKKRPPTPEELIAHYESQGLDSRSASLKAISHLQTLLFRSVSSSARGGGGSAGRGADADRKFDKLSTRLAILEMKLDSKPGIPESVAIGVASGAILHAVGSAVPHLARIWESVKSATKSSNSSS